MAGHFWITMAGGGRFYYDSPHDSDIIIEDIAHHLSQIGRFAGATTNGYWSVCQHSILVAWIIEHVLKGSYIAVLFGLIHDAHEAVINDIPTPFAKYLEDVLGRDVIELCKKRYDEAIFFRLIGRLPTDSEIELIKMADKLALVTEAKQFVKNSEWTARFDVKPLDIKLVPVSQDLAANMFLTEYRRLDILTSPGSTHAA